MYSKGRLRRIFSVANYAGRPPKIGDIHAEFEKKTIEIGIFEVCEGKLLPPMVNDFLDFTKPNFLKNDPVP